MISLASNERIGVVVNPRAGGGLSEMGDALHDLFERLAGHRLLVLNDTVEQETAVAHGIACDRIPQPADPVNAQTAACRLLESGATGLIGVGGDGTLCDIASALLSGSSSAWLLGVGVGSANVGPLVAVRAEDIEILALDCLDDRYIHGVEASVAGASLGVAFNDVAFANTYFGTRDGRRVDLDAAAKLAGNDCFADPSPVCSEGTWIRKNGSLITHPDPGRLSQLVASPINDPQTYAGLAVSGLLCWGPYVGQHAVLTAASAVMIRTRLTAADVAAVEPLLLMHVGFGEKDTVQVGGFRSGAVAVLDGNPMRCLVPSDTVTLRLRMNVVRTLRPSRDYVRKGSRQ